MAVPVKRLSQQGVAAPNCGLGELCLPRVFPGGCAETRGGSACADRRIKRGESLYRIGDSFSAVYPVRFGFFKTTVTSATGYDQVMSFHMRGEMMGIDGLGTGRHSCTAVALADSMVCTVPFELLEDRCASSQHLQRELHRAISRQLDQGQNVMLMLGSMHADERLAAYLLTLSERFGACGYSRFEFNLCMTREEIGSLIGLKLETVSRGFSRFHEDKLISVSKKNVAILNMPGLRRIIGHRAEPI